MKQRLEESNPLVAVDANLLEEHRSFEDARLGIREQFLDLELSAGRTFGVLSRPLGAERPFGWVVCHSFGTEQIDLQMTEVTLARRIAAAGYPVLRFHCQGYGDSEDLSTPPGIRSQIRDTTEVVRRMQEMSGVPAGGAVGARVGAMVAALVADREGLSHLAMIAPIVDGARYMKEQVRVRLMAELVKSAGPAGATGEEARRTLEAGGVVSIKGWPLHGHIYREVRGVSLLSELRSFRGSALMIQVSRSPSLQAELRRLESILLDLGAAVALEVVTDPAAPHFGYEHFQSPDQEVLADSLSGLNASLASSIGRWLERTDGSRTEQADR